MSKELEAFNRIMETYGKTNSLEGTYDEFLTIKRALQRLEQIDNSTPGEALECLKNIEAMGEDCLDDCCVVWFNVVKQTLLKAQEQEEENTKLKGQIKYLGEIITDFQKVLKIVFEKNVQVNNLKKCKTLEEYNILWTTDELTQEEFDTLEEWTR